MDTDLTAVKASLSAQVSDLDAKAAELTKGNTSDPELQLLINRLNDQVEKVKFVLGQVAAYQAKIAGK